MRRMTIRDARLLARIINLADRCRCIYTLLSAEHHGDDSAYHVSIELHGAEDALQLLDAQINRLLANDQQEFYR
jgi:hypothetical protein